jgi:hypothetical protein
MKQLLMILLIAGVTSLSASAQKNYRNNDGDDRRDQKYDRNDGYADNGYDSRNRNYDKNDSYQNNGRNRQEMKRQMAIINRDYDSRTNSVRRSPFMRARVKARKIQDLEYERRVALQTCMDRFSGRRNGYSDNNGNNRRQKW